MITTRELLLLFIIAIVFSLLALINWKDATYSSIKSQHLLVQDVSIKFDDIQSISLRKNGENFTFELQNGEWWQTLPFNVRLDTHSMSILIHAVKGVVAIGELPDSTNLASIGFDNQSDVIAMSDGNETIQIRLGRKALGGRAYAQLGEDTPLIVDQSLHLQFIDADYRLWRDVRMFPDFAIDGTRIERIVNDDHLLLDRKSGRWEMLKPVTARVDQDVLLEWVGKLASIRFDSFVVDNPDDIVLFGLNNPVATFQVSDRRGTKYHVLVGGRVSSGSEDRYVMLEGRPVVYKVLWDSLSQLFPHAEIFVDATGSSVSRFDIKRITVRTDGEELQLQRKNEQWLNESGVPFDSNKINALLSWLLDTRPPNVAIGEYPLKDEIATVTFDGYDLAPLDTVRIAKDSVGGFILENGDNVLRLHSEASGKVLDPFTK
jgi:hypothetical protein